MKNKKCIPLKTRQLFIAGVFKVFACIANARYVALCGFILSSLVVFASGPDSTANVALSGYMGINVLHTQALSKDFIRADISGATSGSETSSIVSSANEVFAGVNVEYVFNSSPFAVISGLRYSKLNETIESPGNSYSVPFFYVKTVNQETLSEYLRVNMVSVHTDYLGLPLELKLNTPFQSSNIGVYARTGLLMNIRLNVQKEVGFYNKEMAAYKNEVTVLYDDPSPWYLTGFIGGGLWIGNTNKIAFTIEGNLPNFILAPQNEHSLTLVNAGISIQAGLRFKLNY